MLLPLLLTYINDVANKLNYDVMHFADDTSLFVVNDSIYISILYRRVALQQC